MRATTPAAAARWIRPSTSLETLGLLRPGELAQLRTIGTVRYVDAGTLVAAAGSTATHVQVVGGGELELMARQEGGRATMVVVRTGGVILDIPLLLGNPMPFDALASRDTEMISLSRQRWTQMLASSPSLSLRWMTSIARGLDDDRRRLVVVTSKPLVSQVAYLLLDLADPGTGEQRVVRLSHSAMAHLLGARRQSITRVIAQLRQSDLVSTSYGSTVLSAALIGRHLRPHIDDRDLAPGTRPARGPPRPRRLRLRAQPVRDAGRVIQLLAASNAGELVKSRIGTAAGIPETTVQRYLDLLETLYLIQQIPAWGNNLSRRVTGRPKVALLDTGLAARLNNVTPTAMGPAAVSDVAGGLFEAFVAGELRRQRSWAANEVQLFHFRDRNGIAVGLVLENGDRNIAGIEVKASTTVRQEDFKGLVFLRDKLGKRFKMGIVLYAGQRALPFGDRLLALPHSALWQSKPASEVGPLPDL